MGMGYRTLFILAWASSSSFANDTDPAITSILQNVQTGSTALDHLTTPPTGCTDPSAQSSSNDPVPFAAKTGPYQLEVRSLVCPKGVLFNAWTGSSDAGGMTCGFSVSRDGGETFGSSNIHRATGFETGANPAIACDAEGNLYAICMSLNGRFSSGVLERSVSKDNGKTWSAWRPIFASNPGGPDKPSLVADSTGLHLVFTQLDDRGQANDGVDRNESGNILYTNSSDHGKTWSKPQLLSEESAHENVDLSKHNVWGSQGASIDRDQNGYIFISWAGYHGGGVKFVSNKNPEKTISAPVAISDSDIDVPITQIISDQKGGNLTILLNEAHQFGKIYWITSHDGGKTWSPKHLLSSSGVMPVMTLDKAGKPSLLWSDKDSSGTVKVKYASSNDHGDSFGSPSTVGTGQYPDSSLILLDYQSLAALPDGTMKAFWIKFTGDSITSWQSTVHP
jgi:hypothetical protein